MTSTHKACSNGVQRITADIFDLCELQWQLLTVDAQEARRRAIKAALVLAIATCIALASLLSTLFGLAWLLHEWSGLAVGWSFLIVGGVALLLSLLAGLLGLQLLSKAGESLDGTRREFAENIRWLKGVILNPKTSARNQLRHDSFPADQVDLEESRFHGDR